MRVFFVFFISLISISLQAHASYGAFPDQDATPVSETRQLYLEKAGNIESQLNSIDIKWNWIVARPAEDSIAKAEGWYVKMEARKNQLKTDFIEAKTEQILDYYQDIIDLYGSNDEVLKQKMAHMKENRDQTAPDYPEIEALPMDENSLAMLKSWIELHPAQYTDFTDYLEKLVLGQ